MIKPTCRCCQGQQLDELIDFGLQPVVHNLLCKATDTFEAYPFSLVFCAGCGLVQLKQSFPKGIFYRNYFTLSSWKLQPHASYLIEVIQRLLGPLNEKKILEIGCNDGSFLELICKAIDGETPKGKISAFEPSKDAFEVAQSKGFDVTNEFFGVGSIENSDLAATFDLIISRQVFEHIDDTADFLKGVALALKADGTLVLEVPNFLQNLENLDYTLWEEHVAYYTPSTLRACLQRNGFHIFHTELTLFAGSALTVFAKRVEKATHDDSQPIYQEGIDYSELRLLKRYTNLYPVLKEKLVGHAKSLNSSRLIIYGCGARSCFFANNMLGDLDVVFLDDRSEKVGKFIPRSLAPIVSWENNMVKNFIYLGVNAEAEHTLIKRRGLKDGSYYSILPPSVHLPPFWKRLASAA